MSTKQAIWFPWIWLAMAMVTALGVRPHSCEAQSLDDLDERTEVRVYQKNADLPAVGHVTHADDDVIVLRVDGQREPKVIRREDVAWAQARTPARLEGLRHAMVATTVVAAIGVMAYAATDDIDRFGSRNHDELAQKTMLYVLPAGIAVNLLLGLATSGSDQWQDVPVQPLIMYEPVENAWRGGVAFDF